MTSSTGSVSSSVVEPTITTEDLRRKAHQIRELAQSEVRRVSEQELARTLTIAALAVVAAVSFAYFLGAKRR